MRCEMTMRTLPLAATVLALAAGVAAADKKIQAKDLPPAVEKAVREETRGATIKGYSKEVEHGKTKYEVETLVNGHTRDLLFDATGHLIAAEEAVSVDAVPAPVKTALEARGKVLSVETVTKGNTITYEAQVEKNGKKSEVVVGADGRPAKP
jgi:uncharacterized membrane protein YkoI